MSTAAQMPLLPAPAIAPAAPAGLEARPVVRCQHCRLVQYQSVRGRCVRCCATYAPAAPETGSEAGGGAEDGMQINLRRRMGAALLRLRQARHISQKELARRCHISRPNICAFERGGRLPALKSFIALAAGLGLPAAMLAMQLEDPARADWLAEVAAYAPRLSPAQRQRILEGKP